MNKLETLTPDQAAVALQNAKDRLALAIVSAKRIQCECQPTPDMAVHPDKIIGQLAAWHREHTAKMAGALEYRTLCEAAVAIAEAALEAAHQAVADNERLASAEALPAVKKSYQGALVAFCVALRDLVKESEKANDPYYGTWARKLKALELPFFELDELTLPPGCKQTQGKGVSFHTLAMIG